MNLVRMNDDMEFSIRDTKIITFWKNNNKNVKNIHKFSTFSSLFLDQGVVWTARELGIFLKGQVIFLKLCPLVVSTLAQQ